MVRTSVVAGLRVSELTGLLLTAVTLQPTPTLRVVGKGRKERSLPLWKQTAGDLRAWLAVRGETPRTGTVPQCLGQADDPRGLHLPPA